MSSSFKIIEHTTPCQTIREYPQATSTYQEEKLHLSAKQYVPLNRTPQKGDVTILAAHASAFPKELYEPLWEDLLKQSEKAGYGIRSIWMADVANQGASYVLNENKIGNDREFQHIWQKKDLQGPMLMACIQQTTPTTLATFSL